MEARDGGSAPLPFSYAPLPEDAEAAATVGRARRTAGSLRAALLPATAAVLMLVAALAGQLPTCGIVVMSGHQTTVNAAPMSTSSRGPESGVSEKTSGAAAHGGMLGADAGGNAFPWSNAMLQWQRTGFHFQPKKNWMNDPNGPVYYKGWYHLFYQYNPDGAIWGNKIAWGHAASRDLLRWRHLPVAMSPDQWYDINGVWSGSATVLPDGRIVMLYTGSTNASVQVQCMAFPSDPSDPLLINWTKYENNPVMYPPPGVGEKDFRDPTTALFDGYANTKIDILNFGFSLYGYANSKMLWTFRGRFRLDPEVTDNVKSTTTHVLLSASRYRRDPRELWLYLVREEAAQVPFNKHGHCIIDPGIAAECVLYALKQSWIGIIALTDIDKAWQVGNILQHEVPLLNINTRLNHDESAVMASYHLARSAELMPYWITTTTSTFRFVVSPSGVIPNNMFRHSHRLGVLKLSRCAFSFSSPPFLCCQGLRFLWLDHCQDLPTRSTTDHHHTEADKEEELDSNTTSSWECFESLWVLDLRYTDLD